MNDTFQVEESADIVPTQFQLIQLDSGQHIYYVPLYNLLRMRHIQVRTDGKTVIRCADDNYVVQQTPEEIIHLIRSAIKEAFGA